MKICAVDFETFYDTKNKYGLKTMSMTEYIRDSRFLAQTVAVKLQGWKKPRVASYKNDGVRKLLESIDWSETAFVGHHAHFDGLIATHHFGIYPAFWLDTMSMSRLVFGPDTNHGLDAVAKRLGLAGKVHGKALDKVDGIREPDGEALEWLMKYNGDDASDTLSICERLMPAVPEHKLHIANITLRAYVEPVLDLDGELVTKIHEEESARRANLFDIVGQLPECRALMGPKDTPKRVLGSTPKFQALLESLGVDVPMKINKKGEMKPAFARTDLDFQALQDHEDERVRDCVDARLAVKGALVENRSARLLNYVGPHPMPVYLAPFKARTLRWGGGDNINLQNLPRRGRGAALRRTLRARKGHKLYIVDSSQIEARLNSWHSGQHDIVEVFRSGGDVYSHNATPLYGFEVNKHDHNDERFVGKVFTLAAGYQAGARKMNHTFRAGLMGPPVNQTLEETTYFLKRWRQANYAIVNHWTNINDAAKRAFMEQTVVDFGVLRFEGRKGHGFMHLPNDTYLFYPNVEWVEDSNDWRYNGRNGPVKGYGGLMTENAMQALGCVILSDVIVAADQEFPECRMVLTVHDELVFHVPDAALDEFDDFMRRAMCCPPDWAPDLPLACEVIIDDAYSK